MTDVIIKLIASSDYQSIALLKDNGDVLIGSRDNIGQPHSLILKYSSGQNSKIKISDIAW